MKTVAVILNTNQLGGAERSLIEQLSIISDQNDFHFFLPTLELPSTDLVTFIQSKKMSQIEFYSYPSFLYKVSRKNLKQLPLLLFFAPILLWSLIQWHSKFKKFTIFYVNGNKASFPVLAWATSFRRKIKMYWHFRDFPSAKAFKIINWMVTPFIKENSLINLKVIANSYAVETELKKYFAGSDIQCLYNLAGNLPVRSAPLKIKHIGVASMFAPWKGLHSVLLMVALYEKELKKIGIEKISFYGNEIYQTDGEHTSYSTQLSRLSEKFNLSIVHWAGKKPPQEIFAEIDVLIHPSLLPELLCRVMTEDFKLNVPVISTCLGGSQELVKPGVQGLKWELYDYQGLFNILESLNINSSRISELTEKGKLKVDSLEADVKNRLVQLF